MPGTELSAWKEKFTILEPAEREFQSLPEEVQRAFLAVFPEFTRHPWTATPTLDVGPLREMPARWRLKVPGGHRGIYRARQSVPEFEMFQTRDEIYENLKRYLNSRV